MKKLLFIFSIFLLCILATYLTARLLFPIRHMDVIIANAGEIEPALALAVIMAESSFNPDAVSRAGAEGLMQIMPATAQDMARRMGIQDFNPQDIWQPDVNIAIGMYYLNWLYNRYDGDTTLMLAAYNAGIGRVDAWLRNPDLSGCGTALDVIPFPETDNYVRRIGQFRRVYRVLLIFSR